MALRNIRKNEDPILKKAAKPVENFDARLAELLDDMAETMYKAEGVGLAGPQIGTLRQVAVLDAGDGIIEIVNPQILEQSGEQTESEGCLSFPGQYAVTLRPMKIKIKAQDRNANEFTLEAQGFKARIFCHEIDHLSGIIFKDRAVSAKTIKQK